MSFGNNTIFQIPQEAVYQTIEVFKKAISSCQFGVFELLWQLREKTEALQKLKAMLSVNNVNKSKVQSS